MELAWWKGHRKEAEHRVQRNTAREEGQVPWWPTSPTAGRVWFPSCFCTILFGGRENYTEGQCGRWWCWKRKLSSLGQKVLSSAVHCEVIPTKGGSMFLPWPHNLSLKEGHFRHFLSQDRGAILKVSQWLSPFLSPNQEWKEANAHQSDDKVTHRHSEDIKGKYMLRGSAGDCFNLHSSILHGKLVFFNGPTGNSVQIHGGRRQRPG